MAWYSDNTANPSPSPAISESSFVPLAASIQNPPASPPTESSWSWSSIFDYFKLPTSTVGIFVAVSTGLTLIGATSYFVVTRLYRKKKQ